MLESTLITPMIENLSSIVFGSHESANSRFRPIQLILNEINEATQNNLDTNRLRNELIIALNQARIIVVQLKDKIPGNYSEFQSNDWETIENCQKFFTVNAGHVFFKDNDEYQQLTDAFNLLFEEKAELDKQQTAEAEKAGAVRQDNQKEIINGYHKFINDSNTYLAAFEASKKTQPTSFIEISGVDSPETVPTQHQLFQQLIGSGLIKNPGEDGFTIGENDSPIESILTDEAITALSLTQQYELLRQIAFLRLTQEANTEDNTFAKKIKNKKSQANQGFSDKILKATCRTEKAFLTELDKLLSKNTAIMLRSEVANISDIVSGLDLVEAYQYLSVHQKLSNNTNIEFMGLETMLMNCIKHFNNSAQYSIPENKAITYWKQQRAIKDRPTNPNANTQWNEFKTKHETLMDQLTSASPKAIFGRPAARTGEHYTKIASAISQYQELIKMNVNPLDEINKKTHIDSAKAKLLTLMEATIIDAAKAIGLPNTGGSTLLNYDITKYAIDTTTTLEKALNASLNLLAAMVPALAGIFTLIGNNDFEEFFGKNVSFADNSSYTHVQLFKIIHKTLMNPTIKNSIEVLLGQTTSEDSLTSLLTNREAIQNWGNRIFISVFENIMRATDSQGNPIPLSKQTTLQRIHGFFNGKNNLPEPSKAAIRYALDVHGIKTSEQFSTAIKAAVSVENTQELETATVLDAAIWQTNFDTYINLSSVAEIVTLHEHALGTDQLSLHQILNKPDASDQKPAELANWFTVKNTSKEPANTPNQTSEQPIERKESTNRSTVDENAAKWAKKAIAGKENQIPNHGEMLSTYLEKLEERLWTFLNTGFGFMGSQSVLTLLEEHLLNEKTIPPTTRIPTNIANGVKYICKIFSAVTLMPQEFPNSDLWALNQAIETINGGVSMNLGQISNLTEFVQNQYIQRLVNNPKSLITEVDAHLKINGKAVYKKPTKEKLIALVYAAGYLILADKVVFSTDNLPFISKSTRNGKIIALANKIKLLWETMEDTNTNQISALPYDIRNLIASSSQSDLNSTFSMSRTGTIFESTFSNYFAGLQIITESGLIVYEPSLTEKGVIHKQEETQDAAVYRNGIAMPLWQPQNNKANGTTEVDLPKSESESETDELARRLEKLQNQQASAPQTTQTLDLPVDRTEDANKPVEQKQPTQFDKEASGEDTTNKLVDQEQPTKPYEKPSNLGNVAPVTEVINLPVEVKTESTQTTSNDLLDTSVSSQTNSDNAFQTSVEELLSTNGRVQLEKIAELITKHAKTDTDKDKLEAFYELMKATLKKARVTYKKEPSQIKYLVNRFVFFSEYFFETMGADASNHEQLSKIKAVLFIAWNNYIREPAQDSNSVVLVLPKAISAFEVDNSSLTENQKENFTKAKENYEKTLAALNKENSEKTINLFLNTFVMDFGHPYAKKFVVTGPRNLKSEEETAKTATNTSETEAKIPTAEPKKEEKEAETASTKNEAPEENPVASESESSPINSGEEDIDELEISALGESESESQSEVDTPINSETEEQKSQAEHAPITPVEAEAAIDSEKEEAAAIPAEPEAEETAAPGPSTPAEKKQKTTNDASALEEKQEKPEDSATAKKGLFANILKPKNTTQDKEAKNEVKPKETNSAGLFGTKRKKSAKAKTQSTTDTTPTPGQTS